MPASSRPASRSSAPPPQPSSPLISPSSKRTSSNATACPAPPPLSTCDLPHPLQRVQRSDVELIHPGHWLSFHRLHYDDPVHRQSRTWEFVSRSHRGQHYAPSGEPDAVEVVPIMKRPPAEGGDQIILVCQYRPPIQQYCLEFPAGLVDDGESVEQAARRELLEETGFTISRVIKTTDSLFYEPGLSNSSMRLVYAHVNSSPADAAMPHRESDEWSLQTVVLPVERLYERLEQLHHTHGIAIDAKLYTFAYGLTLSAL